MFDPTQNDGRPFTLLCRCQERSFLVLPPLNPLLGPSFWDGDHVVSCCPTCGTSLSWALRHGPPRSAPSSQLNTVETSEGAICLTGHSGALDQPRLSSSAGPAGEASNLPAGLEGAEIEWTFTRFPDGRIVFEEGARCE